MVDHPEDLQNPYWWIAAVLGFCTFTRPAIDHGPPTSSRSERRSPPYRVLRKLRLQGVDTVPQSGLAARE